MLRLIADVHSFAFLCRTYLSNGIGHSHQPSPSSFSQKFTARRRPALFQENFVCRKRTKIQSFLMIQIFIELCTLTLVPCEPVFVWRDETSQYVRQGLLTCLQNVENDLAARTSVYTTHCKSQNRHSGPSFYQKFIISP